MPGGWGRPLAGADKDRQEDEKNERFHQEIRQYPKFGIFNAYIWALGQ
jgi:hypothetical protein